MARAAYDGFTVEIQSFDVEEQHLNSGLQSEVDTTLDFHFDQKYNILKCYFHTRDGRITAER